jgi:c-di-GMP-binding flagellar brake protein YcgR
MEAAEREESLAEGQQSRRADPRFGVDEEARLLLLERDAVLCCHVVDLSLSGCCLCAAERISAGPMARVEVAFKVRGLPFRFSGILQWTDGQKLVGIRFVNVPARRKEELAEALVEIEEENRAKAAEQQAAAEQTGQQTPRPAPVQPSPPAVKTEAQAPDAARAQPGRRERRVEAREAVDTSAAIFLVNVASRLDGRILDLSMSGCRIRTNEHFPVGIYTRVETEFRLDGLPFRLGGVIQAIHDRNTVGLRFLDMSSRKREQLEQLIEEIEEMKRAGSME